MKVNNSAESRRRIDELKRRKRAVILAHYYIRVWRKACR